MTTHKYTNHLVNESSPYLLQHAHNPVEWYPWGEQALERAKEENKPILVSIGYAACHWCHVMERESFEDETTAAIMNEHFINIKIDREERPDLDHIYMDAVQAMTGSGGWPLNVFLTPEAKPFYGGTYYPPQRAYNRASWQETLAGVIQAFRERRHEIDAQAENLTQHLVESNSFGLQPATTGDHFFSTQQTTEAFQNLMKQADKQWGGFGRAPKFPQTFSIRFLLRYYHVSGDKAALQQALLSLDKMIAGGIYDQVGGGFARYSTDTEWLAPHFEKMLYDNALLVSVLSEAFQLTRRESYREVIAETMAFIKRELGHPSGGFYAALDADSEGEEGKFYVWTRQEIQELLGEEADLFCGYFDITEEGNWEHKNILRVKKSKEEFAAERNVPLPVLEELLIKGKRKLLAERAKRVRPLTDDKIILGWNALMNTACSMAFAATGAAEYRELAVNNMQFLLAHFSDPATGGFFHTWKEGQAKYPAFLDDYAFLVQALVHLQEITGDTGWIDRASAIIRHVLANFREENTPFFFYTSVSQGDVIVRKKEVYDGAVPSGNAVMAQNLHQLSLLLDKKEWGEQSRGMLVQLGQAVVKYPGSFGNWACLLQEMVAGTNEIVITGEDVNTLRSGVLREYIPHRVFMSAEKPDDSFPLLAGKPVSRASSIWLCRNYTCQAPVFSTKELMLLINRPPGQ